jgi:hypothetical protein
MPHDYTARLTGLRAAAAGKYFERELETLHARWEAEGVARIRKMPVPTVSLRRRGAGGAPARIVVAAADPDFYGVLPDGRAVAMEAKRTSRHLSSMSVAMRGEKVREGIRIHQLRALVDIAVLGGLVALVWKNGEELGVLGARALADHLTLEVGSASSSPIPWSRFTRIDRLDQWLEVAKENA